MKWNDYLDKYKIKGTTFLNPPDDYKNEDTYENFQENLEVFKSKLIEYVKNKEGKTIK